MIVELFGAPSAGKTTLASALARRLTREQRTTELVLSLRYAEQPIAAAEARAGPGDHAPRRRRHLGQLAHKVARGASLLLLGRGGVAAELLRRLPPRSRFWWFRLRHYLDHLDEAWQRARRSDATFIFDQGFAQALCSLILLDNSPTPEAIRAALEVLPRPDLLIHLHAPEETVRQRLTTRCQQQQLFESFLELDLQTSLQQVTIIDEVSRQMQRQGWPIIHVASLDQSGLCAAVERIVQAITSPMADRPAPSKSIAGPAATPSRAAPTTPPA